MCVAVLCCCRALVLLVLAGFGLSAVGVLLLVCPAFVTRVTNTLHGQFIRVQFNAVVPLLASRSVAWERFMKH